MKQHLDYVALCCYNINSISHSLLVDGDSININLFRYSCFPPYKCSNVHEPTRTPQCICYKGMTLKLALRRHPLLPDNTTVSCTQLSQGQHSCEQRIIDERVLLKVLKISILKRFEKDSVLFWIHMYCR